MSRTPDYKTKDEILERILDSLSQNGLNNLSLRDIAKEVGVSARMLIFHFGSYEAIINSIFIQLSIKHKNILRNLLLEHSDKSLGQILQIAAEIIINSNNKNSLLLFIELYTKALRNVNKYDVFFDEVLQNWINEIEFTISNKYGKNYGKYATIIVAFYRGLLLDWLATTDNKRIFESNKTFTDLIIKSMK